MKIIFVRHGDPKRGSFSLTEKGRKEANLLGIFFSGQSIEKIFSAPSVRAKETTKFFLETFSKDNPTMQVEFVEWLNEFKHKILLPDGTEQFAWEMPLDTWCTTGGMLDFANCMDNLIYQSGDIKQHAERIWNGFDEFLIAAGYRRTGSYYSPISEGNKLTFLFVSHFATISVLLAHLLNIPPAVMLHYFWQAPSAFTTLRSEEMERGKVLFRCVGYGETRHLEGHDELKSFYGLKPEVFEHLTED
mgnify:CR=1 FL=1